MYSQHPISFAYCTQSYTSTPTLVPGAAVTMGFSNTPGTAVALIGTALTHDVEMLEVTIGCATTATGLSTTDTSAIIDILIDTAGGTSWDTTNIFIEGLFAGFLNLAASTVGALYHRRWYFPVWLPAGTTIAARGQSSVASGNVQVEVGVNAYGGVSHPEKYWCGQKVDAIGLTKASSKGTSVTPNATLNTYSAFTSIGSATTRRYGCLLPSMNPNSGTISGNTQLELGIGGTKIGRTYNLSQASTELCGDFFEDKRLNIDVPEATQLQARVRNGTGTGNAMQVIIHGVS